MSKREREHEDWMLDAIILTIIGGIGWLLWNVILQPIFGGSKE